MEKFTYDREPIEYLLFETVYEEFLFICENFNIKENLFEKYNIDENLKVSSLSVRKIEKLLLIILKESGIKEIELKREVCESNCKFIHENFAAIKLNSFACDKKTIKEVKLKNNIIFFNIWFIVTLAVVLLTSDIKVLIGYTLLNITMTRKYIFEALKKMYKAKYILLFLMAVTYVYMELIFFAKYLFLFINVILVFETIIKRKLFMQFGAHKLYIMHRIVIKIITIAFKNIKNVNLKKENEFWYNMLKMRGYK